MSNLFAALVRISIFVGCSMVLSIGCTESSQQDKLRAYLSSINAAEVPGQGTTPVPQPGLQTPTSTQGTAHAIVGGTPREVKDGFCGDGVINGTTEDCDQNAIQNTNCRDYGGLGGEVRCQQNCLYDISDCITPAVDKKIGGIAETCKCDCNSSSCRGGCQSTNLIGQSLCRFDCDNDCICRCEGKMEAHVENCEVRCACTIDAAGNPVCECTMDQCELLTTISPNIGTLTSNLQGVIGH